MKNLLQTNLLVNSCGNDDDLKNFIKSSPAQQVQDFMNYEVYDKNQENVLKFFLNLAPLSSLILTGPPGSGKDHLIMAYLREQIRLEVIETFFNNTLGSLIRLFRDLAYKLGYPETKAFDLLCSFDCLVIRDVGSYTTTEKGFDFFNELIDFYVENGKQIILTTNLMPSALKLAVGERVYDRLHSVVTKYNGKKIVPCIWESYRRKELKSNAELAYLLALLPPESGQHGVKRIKYCKICKSYFESGENCFCLSKSTESIIEFCKDNHSRLFINKNILAGNYQEIISEHTQANERYLELKSKFEKKYNLKK